MKSFSILLVWLALMVFSVVHADTITIEYENNKHALLPSYVLKCKAVAYEKLRSQAEAFDIEVDMNTMRLTGVSENALAKYLWWSVDVSDINGRTDVFPDGKAPILTKLTQKPLGGDCF